MDTGTVNLFDPFGGAYWGMNVLVTGHTGFKGSWLSIWLSLLGANVYGYALDPVSALDNFVLSGLGGKMTDIRRDIRDIDSLKKAFMAASPVVVFHLAAQPLVRRSYEAPVQTFETNIMGTVNVLENVRLSKTVKACVIITSDKCYENNGDNRAYRETDPMGGYDPYSASKGCAELAASAYSRSFLQSGFRAVSTVRAGNVIGGGDWSCDRLIPDCIRALEEERPVYLRNPGSIRPWQHVLEPLYGYLLLGVRLINEGEKYSGAWNFGPDSEQVITVKAAADELIRIWGSGTIIEAGSCGGLHESRFLSLDCTKAKTELGWKPVMDLKEALRYTVYWYKNYKTEDIYHVCRSQIRDFVSRIRGEEAIE